MFLYKYLISAQILNEAAAFRGHLKDLARTIVRTAYAIIPMRNHFGPISDSQFAKEKRKYISKTAEDLLKNYTFTKVFCSLVIDIMLIITQRENGKPYEHQAIWEFLAQALFGCPTAVGIQDPNRYNPMPLPCISFACTVVSSRAVDSASIIYLGYRYTTVSKSWSLEMKSIQSHLMQRNIGLYIITFYATWKSIATMHNMERD